MSLASYPIWNEEGVTFIKFKNVLFHPDFFFTQN